MRGGLERIWQVTRPFSPAISAFRGGLGLQDSGGFATVAVLEVKQNNTSLHSSLISRPLAPASGVLFLRSHGLATHRSKSWQRRLGASPTRNSQKWEWSAAEGLRPRTEP